MLKGECNEELRSYGCQTIQGVQGEKINTWKGGKKLCVLRDPQYSLYNSFDSICMDDVPNGYKRCGTSQKVVCRKLTDACPITYMTKLEDTVGSVTGKTISVANGVNYNFEGNTAGNLPIMGFRLDEYAPCADTTQKNISPNKAGEYILMAERREYCRDVDDRAKVIDTIGEETLFQMNTNLWNKVTNVLPSYPRPSEDYVWVLSYMSYPFWAYECRSSERYKMEMTVKYMRLQGEASNIQHFILFTSMSIIAVSCLIVILEIYRRMKKKRRDRQIRNLERSNSYIDKNCQPIYKKYIPIIQNQWARRTLTIIGVDRFFKLLNIPSLFIIYFRFQRSAEFFNQVIDIGCGDSYFNDRIAEDYKQSLNDSYQYTGAMLGLWWLSFIIDWIYLLYRYYNEIKPNMLLATGNYQSV